MARRAFMVIGVFLIGIYLTACVEKYNQENGVVLGRGNRDLAKSSSQNDDKKVIAELNDKIEKLERKIKSLEIENKKLRNNLEQQAQYIRKLEETKEPRVIIRMPTGEDIQKALKNAGFYNGTIDGVIGEETKEAIKKFQKEKGLIVDGIVGSKTWDKLKDYLNHSLKE